MSHASGEVWSKDGKLLGYFEYDGTCDVVCTRIHLTAAGVREHWRGDNHRNCTCGATGQSVVLYTDYGFGCYWPGRVCWACMAVVDGIDPEGAEDGHPFLDEWMLHTYGQLLPCPSCGQAKLASDGDDAPLVCTGCGSHWYMWQVIGSVPDRPSSPGTRTVDAPHDPVGS